MTPELTEALQQFVSTMINLVNEGINLSIDQLPLVLQDIVGAAILQAQVSWWLGVVLVCFGIVGILFDLIFDLEGLGSFIGAFPLIGGVIVTATAWYDFYYATMFPRLVVLDYLKGLL